MKVGNDSEIRIDRADPGDASFVVHCARAAYQPYVSRIGREPAPMVADFRSQIEAGKVYILRRATRSFGFVVLYPRGDHLHVENVAVSPEAQGGGYGGALLDFAERHASSLGLSSIQLYTNEKMTENFGFYARLGYFETGRRRESGFNRIYFRKSLDHQSAVKNKASHS